MPEYIRSHCELVKKSRCYRSTLSRCLQWKILPTPYYLLKIYIKDREGDFFWLLAKITMLPSTQHPLSSRLSSTEKAQLEVKPRRSKSGLNQMLGTGPVSGKILLVCLGLCATFWSTVHTFCPRWSPDVWLHAKTCKAKVQGARQRGENSGLACSAFLLVIKLRMSLPIWQTMNSCGCDGDPLKMDEFLED